MDKQYWKEYYVKNKAPDQASLFAKYILKNFLKEKETLVEIGCGNGRDSMFFANNNIRVTSIDQCNDKNFEKNLLLRNGVFLKKDFTKLDKLSKKVDHIYSRFTLHSVTKKEQDRTLAWCYSNLKKGGFLHIEVRGKRNELYKKGIPSKTEKDVFIYEDHHRRFVDFKELQNELEDIGFKIIYAKEKKGFAPFKNTNYVFIRIICQK